MKPPKVEIQMAVSSAPQYDRSLMPKGADLVRTLTGESWRGMPVSGWMWHQEVEVPQGGFALLKHFASHWSTGPKHAERLFSEADVRTMLDCWEPSNARELLEVCKAFLGRIGDGGYYPAAGAPLTQRMRDAVAKAMESVELAVDPDVDPDGPDRAQPANYRAHKWGGSGERCTVCGDKDWMSGDRSGASDAKNGGAA